MSTFMDCIKKKYSNAILIEEYTKELTGAQYLRMEDGKLFCFIKVVGKIELAKHFVRNFFVFKKEAESYSFLAEVVSIFKVSDDNLLEIGQDEVDHLEGDEITVGYESTFTPFETPSSFLQVWSCALFSIAFYRHVCVLALDSVCPCFEHFGFYNGQVRFFEYDCTSERNEPFQANDERLAKKLITLLKEWKEIDSNTKKLVEYMETVEKSLTSTDLIFLKVVKYLNEEVAHELLMTLQSMIEKYPKNYMFVCGLGIIHQERKLYRLAANLGHALSFDMEIDKMVKEYGLFSKQVREFVEECYELNPFSSAHMYGKFLTTMEGKEEEGREIFKRGASAGCSQCMDELREDYDEEAKIDEMYKGIEDEDGQVELDMDQTNQIVTKEMRELLESSGRQIKAVLNRRTGEVSFKLVEPEDLSINELLESAEKAMKSDVKKAVPYLTAAIKKGSNKARNMMLEVSFTIYQQFFEKNGINGVLKCTLDDNPYLTLIFGINILEIAKQCPNDSEVKEILLDKSFQLLSQSVELGCNFTVVTITHAFLGGFRRFTSEFLLEKLDGIINEGEGAWCYKDACEVKENLIQHLTTENNIK